MENQISSPEQNERKIDKTLLPWFMLGVIVIGIAVLNLWSVFKKNPEVAKTVVPDFSLTNQQGETINLSDMEGKIWVTDFIFTHCPTICPIMTQEMAKLQIQFDALPVYFISFTVDPDRDTPEVLSRYARQFRANEQQWYFLTGEKEQIYQLAQEGFKLTAVQHRGGFPHSTKFVLVNQNGYIHGYYDSRNNADMMSLRRDVRTLLRDEEKD